MGRVVPAGADRRRWIRDSGINCDIHSLHLFCSFELIGKAPRGRPDEKVGRDAGLRGLHEDTAVLALDLKIRASGSSHRDRLVKFQYCQVIQRRSNMEYALRWSQRLLRGGPDGK